MDWMTYPIDLVVAVQTSANSGAVVDKLGGSGILFTQLLAADAGQTAVISFSDAITVLKTCTKSLSSKVLMLSAPPSNVTMEPVSFNDGVPEAPSPALSAGLQSRQGRGCRETGRAVYWLSC